MLQDSVVLNVRRSLFKAISSFRGNLRNEEDMLRLIQAQFRALKQVFNVPVLSEEDADHIVAVKLLNLYRTGRLGHFTLDSLPWPVNSRWLTLHLNLSNFCDIYRSRSICHVVNSKLAVIFQYVRIAWPTKSYFWGLFTIYINGKCLRGWSDYFCITDIDPFKFGLSEFTISLVMRV